MQAQITAEQEASIIINLQVFANMVEMILGNKCDVTTEAECRCIYDAIDGIIHGTAVNVVKIFDKLPCFAHIHPAGSGKKLGAAPKEN